MVVTYYAVLWSVALIPISISMIVLNLNPFWTCIFAFYLNKEPFTRVDLTAMVVCFAAVVGIALTSPNGEDAPDEYDYMMSGIILALLSSVGIAISGVIVRYLRGIYHAVVIGNATIYVLVVSMTVALIDHAVHEERG